MTRREAFQELIVLCLGQSRALNEFLLSIQGKVDEQDFVELRDMVGSIMGETLTSAITPIVNEFPDLKPHGFP